MSLTIDKSEVFINNIQNQSAVYTLLMMPESDSLTITVHVVDKMLTLFQQYNSYINVFSEETVDKLSFHQDYDHVIEIKRHKLLYDSLYNLLKTEL